MPLYGYAWSRPSTRISRSSDALKATEQPVDTGTVAGKAFLDMLGVFAEFETNLRRERQLEGISAAKARGVYKGPKPSIDVVEILRLRREEKLDPAAIARWLGIGRASVYRLLGEEPAVSANGGVDAELVGVPAVAPWREVAAGYGVRRLWLRQFSEFVI